MDRIQRDAAEPRAFNRFLTLRIGILQEGLPDSRPSLTEVRVLDELNARTARWRRNSRVRPALITNP